MPAARGVKRTASKSSGAATSKSKKKRGGNLLEIPVAPKIRGRLLACGQNDVGQLGLGEDVVETNKFKYITALGDNIVDVCAGGMHSVALDANGKVWTFGCNDEGALGRPTSGDSDEGTPTAVVLPKKVVAITAGDSHTAALLDNGDVYAWGAFRDSHGSMGLVVQGRAGKPCREPVHIAVGEPAAGIASGGDHLVILSVSGNVYTMGCGEQGQLGRLAQRSASRNARQGFSALLAPARVTLRPGASRVWAGFHATFALDAAGARLWAWGLNNYGQLGVTGEKRKTALYSPTECEAFAEAEAAAAGAGEAAGARWAQLSCGQHHSLALDAAGVCYAIGRCEYGRLGLGDRAGDAEALEPVPALRGKRCLAVAAGTSSSFAFTDNGEVYAWGMGSEGQLGTGAAEDAAAPARLAPPAAAGAAPRALSAGGLHTLLLLSTTAEPESTSQPMEVSETPEQKVEDNDKDKEKRTAKRQKKQADDDEISSTSDLKAESTEHSPLQKINGNETKTTPMEVEETDKSEPEKTDPQPNAAQGSPDTKSSDLEPEAPDLNGSPEPEAGPNKAEEAIASEAAVAGTA